jgi:2-dehydro-3-deoxyphosphogluconate aldolase / (4S)-4-hydroxy-2-oxoglutarate aldolase
MAKFSRIEVALTMRNGGIVPVFYSGDPDLCKKILEACYEGGIRVFEFTNRGDFAHEIFAELMRFSAKRFPDMLLGAGSLLEESSTALFIQNGANFIVSPIMHEGMARICNRRKILWIPGCASVSEISKAEELGAEIVKIFPAEVGGPSFIKSIRGPMPWTNIMPTGGVEPERNNLMQWFSAGAWCAGIGSKLFTHEIIHEKNFTLLTAKVKELLQVVRDIQVELKMINQVQ